MLCFSSLNIYGPFFRAFSGSRHQHYDLFVLYRIALSARTKKTHNGHLEDIEIGSCVLLFGSSNKFIFHNNLTLCRHVCSHLCELFPEAIENTNLRKNYCPEQSFEQSPHWGCDRHKAKKLIMNQSKFDEILSHEAAAKWWKRVHNNRWKWIDINHKTVAILASAKNRKARK